MEVKCKIGEMRLLTLHRQGKVQDGSGSSRDPVGANRVFIH